MVVHPGIVVDWETGGWHWLLTAAELVREGHRCAPEPGLDDQYLSIQCGVREDRGGHEIAKDAIRSSVPAAILRP